MNKKAIAICYPPPKPPTPKPTAQVFCPPEKARIRQNGALRSVTQKLLFFPTFPFVSLPEPGANLFIHQRARLWGALARRAPIILACLPSSQWKKQTSVKFEMSLVNLLEPRHLSRNTNTCSLIAFLLFFSSPFLWMGRV